MQKQGKNYKAALAKVDLEKQYTPQEAVALAKETAYTKFDASVEVHMRTALDPARLTSRSAMSWSCPMGWARRCAC